jgi:hypothetical protein
MFRNVLSLSGARPGEGARSRNTPQERPKGSAILRKFHGTKKNPPDLSMT